MKYIIYTYTSSGVIIIGQWDIIFFYFFETAGNQQATSA